MRKHRSATTENRQAIGYVRVSTAQQTELGVSLEAQEERIRAYCLLQGLELVSIVREEGVSASIELFKRPGGCQLVRMLGRSAQHVVTLKLDRLFRDVQDCLSQTDAWDKANVSLHILDLGGQTLNTGSAMGRMFLVMTAGFAELERNLIAERTANALRHKKSNHKVYSPTPFGYCRVDDKLIPIEAEQRVIEDIKLLRESGESLQAIADTLNGRSIPTKIGGKWHPSTVTNILQNTLHAIEVAF